MGNQPKLLTCIVPHIFRESIYDYFTVHSDYAAVQRLCWGKAGVSRPALTGSGDNGTPGAYLVGVRTGKGDRRMGFVDDNTHSILLLNLWCPHSEIVIMISSIKTQIGVYFFAVSCKTLVNRDKYKEGSSCDDFECGLHTCTRKHLWLEKKLHKFDRYRWPYMLTFSIETGLHQMCVKKHFGLQLLECWLVLFTSKCFVVFFTCSWLIERTNPGVGQAGDSAQFYCEQSTTHWLI